MLKKNPRNNDIQTGLLVECPAQKFVCIYLSVRWSLSCIMLIKYKQGLLQSSTSPSVCLIVTIHLNRSVLSPDIVQDQVSFSSSVNPPPPSPLLYINCTTFDVVFNMSCQTDSRKKKAQESRTNACVRIVTMLCIMLWKAWTFCPQITNI